VSVSRESAPREDDRVWRVERKGIEPVPATERRASLTGLFWVWFAGNLAILTVVLGAVAMSFGLSLLEGVAVALLAPLCYAGIGLFGIAGARTGAPTLTLSRATFGTYGNVVPALVSWLNLIGWETVVLLTAAYALEAALTTALGVPASAAVAVLALGVTTVAAFSVALLGHATIVRIQTWASYLFGALTLVVFGLALPRVHLQVLLAHPGAPFLTAFLPALSIVVAGGALSWVNTASDYTRYLPTRVGGAGVVAATTLGSLVPSFALLLLGVLLSAGRPGLAAAQNPVAAIGSLLPAWMAVPYLVTAAGGMIAGDIMDVYSSGLSLLAAGVPLRRTRTILVDAALSISVSLYVLLAAQDFLGAYVSFLGVLGAVLAPWAAVFGVDAVVALRRGYRVSELYRGGASAYGRVRPWALASWVLGAATALLTTSVPPILRGPFAVGILQGSNLGLFLGFAVSLALYLAVRGLGGARA